MINNLNQLVIQTGTSNKSSKICKQASQEMKVVNTFTLVLSFIAQTGHPKREFQSVLRYHTNVTLMRV